MRVSEWDEREQGPVGADAPARAAGRRWPALLLVSAVALLGFAAVEMRSSTIQSRLLSDLVDEAGYGVVPGPSPDIVFPDAGPYDERLGYTRIQAFVDSLRDRGFHVEAQARVSERFAELVRWGVYPLYQEKPAAGLTIRDVDGRLVHETLYPRLAYASFDSIPEVLWKSLLWIEDRALLDPEAPATRNPAVDWTRLARSVAEMGMRALGSERNVPGGSTLATQIEKFRHSPEGLTRTPGDKLRQMATASARAYLDGPETVEARRRLVRTYLNGVPLAAQRGHGEVLGTAEGLWAWYGTPFADANRLLGSEGGSRAEHRRRGQVYRQALSLLLAQRRPTWYLTREEGREELQVLTDRHLRAMEQAGVIRPRLAREARQARIRVLERAPEEALPPFVERKAAAQLRTHLLGLLGVESLYDLDRLDMEVGTTLDLAWQEETSTLLRSLADSGFVRSVGLAAPRLLARGDPAGVVYSLTLMETTPTGNAIRVQADNFEGPLSMSEGGRLELGSTAKLRTLVSYLEAVAELHGRLAPLPREALDSVRVAERDRLTRWVVERLRANPGADLRSTLEAAMERRYPAAPGERFATGGGVQTFSNFDDTWDGQLLTVREAFRHSVNLPWVRIMRDLVRYHTYRSPGSAAWSLDDPAVRSEYLSRFADQEGSRFVGMFHAKYAGLEPSGILDTLVEERALGPERMAWAYRTVRPEATEADLVAFLGRHATASSLSPEALESLWRRTDPAPHSLHDLGYLARIHPLELWVVRHLLENPGADRAAALEASREVRQEVYQWLFRSRRRDAQDQRIQTMLEIEAFQEIRRSWRRLGYPFANLVPSYGTAIGSSGDRPLALAELVGILLNDGVRHPVVRVEEVALAAGTPFETRMARGPSGPERVLPAEVAQVAREALVDVVEEGTGRRVRDAFRSADGEPLVVGGKTGTGDNQFRVYGEGGRLIGTRTVNRTAAFAFFAGDRYFGVVTAYVPGEEAADYDFTSGLPLQVLRTLAPRLEGLDGGTGPEGVAATEEGAASP